MKYILYITATINVILLFPTILVIADWFSKLDDDPFILGFYVPLGALLVFLTVVHVVVAFNYGK